MLYYNFSLKNNNCLPFLLQHTSTFIGLNDYEDYLDIYVKSFSANCLEKNKVHISMTNSKLFFLSLSPLIIPPYHPGDGCIAKWSRSSCITEDTAGTVTTASPAPAVTRSCLMELVLSWTFTPLKMTTCWMGTLPPQVGNTGTTGYPPPPPMLSSLSRP